MQRRRSKGKSDGIHEARLRGNDRHQRDTFYMGALPPPVWLSPVESESEGPEGWVDGGGCGGACEETGTRTVVLC